ncbi:hypothetical protein EVAR_100626_1 [Eumeta japonica]|uniref:Uncharacterized protein n=1 Tax=Eumeta variegata TaxID=151549 RepID=A0A4C1ZPA6_EUMVA|nr:hypothetical protein EVAR_100626_1 [Eumeta japonica]
MSGELSSKSWRPSKPRRDPGFPAKPSRAETRKIDPVPSGTNAPNILEITAFDIKLEIHTSARVHKILVQAN